MPLVFEKAGHTGVEWAWKKVQKTKSKVIKGTLCIVNQYKTFSFYFEKGRVGKIGGGVDVTVIRLTLTDDISTSVRGQIYKLSSGFEQEGFFLTNWRSGGNEKWSGYTWRMQLPQGWNEMAMCLGDVTVWGVHPVSQ